MYKSTNFLANHNNSCEDVDSSLLLLDVQKY